MISGSECRDIAAQLRKSRDFVSSLPKASLEQNAFDTFERVLECVHYDGGNLFDYLARLKREYAWENEQWRQEEITCPWCGYVDTDIWEFEGEYDDEYECPSCGKPFIIERVVDITYTSKRRIEDMPEGWDGE